MMQDATSTAPKRRRRRNTETAATEDRPWAVESLLPLSPSRLATFDTCPLRGQYQHVQRIPETPTEWQVRGRVHHATMARYAEHCLRSGQDTDPDWLAQCDLPAGVAEIRFPAIADSEWYLEYPLAVACDGRPTHFDDPAAWWRGRPDFIRVIRGHAVIKDWKLSWRIPPVTDPVPDQLLDYAWACERALSGVSAITVELVYLPYGAVRSWTLTPDEIAGRMQQMRAHAERIIERGPEAQLGTHCATCSYTRICPSYQTFTARVPTTDVAWHTPDEAKHGALQLLLIEGYVKRLQQRARDWCDTHGSIALNDGQTLGYTLRHERRVTDTAMLIDGLAAEHGITRTDVIKALTMPVSTVEKILRTFARIRGKALAQWWDDVAVPRGWAKHDAKTVFGWSAGGAEAVE